MMKDSDSSPPSGLRFLFTLDLTYDGWLLLAARFLRLFSYGWVSVGLIVYLLEIGLTQWEVGLLFTATLIGDLIVTFALTTTADSIGRKTTLIIGSILKIFAGTMFAFQSNFIGLLVAGILGIISPSGGEIGPFLACEQSALTESITRLETIPVVFGWFQALSYCAQALGALAAGITLMSLQVNHGWSILAAHRFLIIGYGAFGVGMLAIYLLLSPSIEPLHARAFDGPRDWFSKFGLHRKESRKVVLKLSALFILDAFAGGFVMQSVIVYWFGEEWAMSPDRLGALMLGANLLAGISAIAATPLVGKIGAINTMVATHLPSNILLIMVPFMPTMESAVGVLLARFAISQMDVPARQTYVATVVDADERSAAGGITSVVRSIGLSVSPILTGYLIADPTNHFRFSLIFILAGVIKSTYDILLYLSFRASSGDGASGEGGKTVTYTRVGVNAAEVAQQIAAAPDNNLYDETFEQEQDAKHARK